MPVTKRKPDSAIRDISPPPNAKRQNTAKSTGSTPYPTTNYLVVSSFFTPLGQKKTSPNKMEWQVREGTLLVGKYRAKDIKPHPKKIAAFDLVCSCQVLTDS
jgi:hypothetical protein